MSTIKCKFCGTEIGAQFCKYCGFFNVYNFGGVAEDKAAIEKHKKSSEYRASQMFHDVTLKNIKDISIFADAFKYNENKTALIKTGQKSLFDSNIDGIKCSNGIVKSNEWIAHFDGSADVTIHYTFGGTKKSVTAKISPEASEGLWYLTLHINEELRLEVGLCVAPVCGKGSSSSVQLATVDLDLIA